jgi:hypothetical protein
MIWLLFIILCNFELANPQNSFSRAKYPDLFAATNSQWFKDYTAVKENAALSIVPEFQNPRAQGKFLFLSLHSTMFTYDRFLCERNHHSRCRLRCWSFVGWSVAY